MEERPPSIRLTTLTIVCFLLSVLGAASQSTNSYCTQETPDPSEHTRPKLDYSYTTQITGRWVHDKQMETIHEYYDKDDDKLAFDTTSGGERWTNIFDLKTKHWLFYHGVSSCTYWKDYHDENISNNGYKSIEILMEVGNVWKYKGEATIRGVELQQWRSCNVQKWRNFTADYYFTKTTLLPFRLDLIGRQSKGSQTLDMRIVYDYFLFNKAKPSPDVFKPIPGVVCDKFTTVVTPPIVMSGSFQMEIIDPKIKTVSNMQVFYDKQKQISSELSDDMSVVNDYVRGIRFEINEETQECSRKALTRFADSGQTVDNNGMIHMASLKHFLFDDGKFTYNGVYKARGISCDVYTKKSQAGEALGASLVEIYIARPEVKITNKEGSVLNALQQPVRVVMKGASRDDPNNMVVKRQYEIYDFLAEEFPYNYPFDLSPCYDQKHTIAFEMTLKGQAAGSRHWTGVLKRNAGLAISSALYISLLRVKVESARVSDGVIIVRGYIFGKEIPFTLFQTVRDMKLTSTLKAGNFFTYKNESYPLTPSVCADYCVRSDLRPFKFKGYCPAFQFDRSTKECTFYNRNLFNAVAHDENLDYSPTIDFYRVTTQSHNEWQSASYSYSFLQRLVAQGSINVTDTVGDVLIATSLTKVQDEPRDPSKYYGQDSPIKLFTNTSGVISTDPVEVLTKVHLSACARHCVNSLKYNCEAFTFNERTKSCQFYDSTSVRESYSQESKDKRVYTYTRNYFSNFDEISGRSILSPESDAVYTSVGDPNACAELCVKEDAFYCQSFEICDQTCLLGRKHIYNAPTASVNENFSCKHYSRAYIQDYSKTKNKAALTDSKLVEIGNIGVKQCASLCSTSSSYVCDVFEFCDTDSLCRLTTMSLDDASLQYKDSGSCDLYSRKKDRQRFIYSKQTSSGGGSKGSHSPGAMGGIAIGMIVLGVFVAVVGLLVFSRLRPSGPGRDGMSVGFSRKQMEED